MATPTCWIRVGEDRQAPGDEPIWGYAKTMRPHSTQGRPSPSELDAVIAGALVVDPVLGVVKADIGIKDGRIVGVGRAGNPGISDGIELPIGPHTQPIMGYGLIATPGAIDSHVHLDHARAPAGRAERRGHDADHRRASRSRRTRWPGCFATAAWPLNVGLQALRAGRGRRLAGGAPRRGGRAASRSTRTTAPTRGSSTTTLRFAEAHDVSVVAHRRPERARRARGHGRRDRRPDLHAYHVEGSGGGHVPDVIGLVREPNVICSSTTPTVPLASTPRRALPMIVLNHGGSFGVAADVALVRERVHPRRRWPPRARSTSWARSQS